MDVELELAWIVRGEKLLLEQRPGGGRMAGLWQLPTRETTTSALFPPGWADGVSTSGDEVLCEVRHGITRHRIRARVLGGKLTGRPGKALAWFEWQQLGELGLTGMTKKTLARLRPGPSGSYPA